MKKITKIGVMLLCVLLLAPLLASCADKKDPFAITDFYSLTIEKKDTLKASVSLNIADTEAHDGEKAYLYELFPGETLGETVLSQKTPVAEAKIRSEMVFEFPLRDGDHTRLYSTFAVCYENGSLLTDRVKTIDNPASLANSDIAFLGRGTPKGLRVTDVEQAVELGTTHAMIDVQTNSILSGSGLTHRFDGTDYLLSASAIQRLDERVFDAYCAGMQVSLRVDCDIFGAFIPEKQVLPLLDFLANRYCTKERGIVTAFFVEADNARDAADVAVYANSALLSCVKNGRVYVVCGETASEDVCTFFEIVSAGIAERGDFAYGAAISMPRLNLQPWETVETEKTDLNSLPRLIDRIEDLKDAPVYFSVCDLSFDAEDEDLQAVSLAYAYAAAVKAGAGLVYYGTQQGKNGLFDTAGASRESAEMFRKIDLGLDSELSYLCQRISEEAWKTISTLKDSRTLLSGNGVSGYGVGDKEALFDFSSKQLFDFSAVGGISEPEFYDAAAWKKPVLKLWLNSKNTTGIRTLMKNGQALSDASALTVRFYAQYDDEQPCALTLRLVGSDQNGKTVTYESVGSFDSRSWESVTFDVSEFTSRADLAQPCSMTVLCAPEESLDEDFVLFVKDISAYHPQGGGGYLLPILLTLAGILLGFVLILFLYRGRIFKRKRRR